MRKLCLILCLSLCLSTVGCLLSPDSERSTIFSTGYWKRHASKIMEDLHEFRVDIDRTIFDLEDRPIEEM